MKWGLADGGGAGGLVDTFKARVPHLVLYNKKTQALFLTEDNPVGHWPWMSSIGFFNETTNLWKHQCGGSLISNKHFVSAAHCFKRKQDYLQ